MKMKIAFLFSISLFYCIATWSADAPSATTASNPLLPPNARLALLGDSITQGEGYSRMIEVYLVACMGRRDISVFNFGWAAEKAPTFSWRMENDLSVFKPTIATIGYGMNDGCYRPFEEKNGKAYEDAMRVILTKLVAMGVKTVIVGTPSPVDTKFFIGDPKLFPGTTPAMGYNECLRQLRNIDEKLAGEFKMPFADVLTPMLAVMAKAKAANGEDYHVSGPDGVHPRYAGSLCIAYSYLKALGCNGRIGEISVDMKGGATASDGHKILTAADGKVELESTRYPFCFDADPKSPDSTRSILPFLPFNQELNQFVLKVSNLSGGKAKVTWGTESKDFTREQLEAGINLASEFGKTPFDVEFMKFLNKIMGQQQFESWMIINLVSNFRRLNELIKDDTELKNAQELIRNRIITLHDRQEQSIYASLLPLKHTITITPVP